MERNPVCVTELLSDFVPAIFAFHQLARLSAKLVAKLLILKELHDRLPELAESIRDQNVLSLPHAKSFAANRRADDRFARRHRIQDLESGPPTFEEWTDNNAGTRNHRPHIVRIRSHHNARIRSRVGQDFADWIFPRQLQ